MSSPLLRALNIFFVLATTDRSPVSLRHTLENLGPTFVKFGQLIASRPDSFPHAYTEELRKLLDQGQPVTSEQVSQIIRASLGKDTSELFLHFEPTPISSASIGQVHKAQLKNRQTVAVKIRRPGIKSIVEADITILNSLSKIVSILPAFQGTQVDKIVEEFSYWIKNELDFRTEAFHAEKLAQNLAKVEYVDIPKVYTEFTTEETLITSFEQGITLNQLLNQMRAQNLSDPQKARVPFKIDYELVTSRLLECYIFKQILEDGYFHGDPHPANIILLPQNRISFVDFGIMGTLDQNEHKQALMLILSLVDDDPRSLVKGLASISEKEMTKREELEMIDQLSTELHKIHGSDLEHATLGQLSMKIVSLGRHYQLHWSPGVIDCLRAITLLEGAALELVPHASMIELIKPHLKKFFTKQALGKFSEKEVYRTIYNWMQLSEKVGSISNLIGENGIKVETTGKQD